MDDKIQQALRKAQQTGDYSPYYKLICRRDGHNFGYYTTNENNEPLVQCEFCAEFFPARYMIIEEGTYGNRNYWILDTKDNTRASVLFNSGSTALRSCLVMNNRNQY